MLWWRTILHCNLGLQIDTRRSAKNDFDVRFSVLNLPNNRAEIFVVLFQGDTWRPARLGMRALACHIVQA